MDLATILKVHREPIIDEWVRRLHTEVSPRYAERPLEELLLTVSRVYDANFAVILRDDYSLIDAHIEWITRKAVKYGAFEYNPKPIDVEELERAIDRAIKSLNATPTGKALLIDSSLAYGKGKVIGQSRGMKEIFKNIGLLSENRVTVLIEGETGTGKELIARAIHYNSPSR